MSDVYADALLQISKKLPLEESVLHPDGLQYCSKCNTPVQCRLQFGEILRTVRCLCKCEQEQREREAQRRREQEKKIQIQRMRSTGIQEPHLMRWNFSVAKDTPYVQMAQEYMNNWKQAKEENLGLLLWGDVGTGKSFLAACIANALIERYVPVLMTNFSKILNQMGGLYSGERYDYVTSFSKYPLLIIDDLGIERSTEYTLEQIYAVIDERYKARLPLIVTTNLTVFQMRNPQDLGHARIYSRILAMCTPIHIAGSDLRVDIRGSKQALAKEILLLESGGDES